MNFYQELQLDAAGSKKHIASFHRRRDKVKHYLIFLLKILLNVAFSVVFVSVFAQIFGPANTITAVVVLLCVMLFRTANLSLSLGYSIPVLWLLFGILATGPHLANLVPLGWSFVINLVSLFLLVFFGCHQAKQCNHFILVLSYLLLLGSDVTGWNYVLRLICLAVGATLVTIIFSYKNYRKHLKGNLLDFCRTFRLDNEDTRWQIKFTLCLSTVLLIGAWLQLPKYTWVGIAAMSVCFPFRARLENRALYRIVGNLAGCGLFLALSFLLPTSLADYFGIFGGFCLGFCALYGWQCLFNSFSAVTMAATTLGLRTAVTFRVVNNLFGAVYALIFDLLCERLLVALDQGWYALRHHFHKTKVNTNLPAIIGGNALHPYEQLVRDLTTPQNHEPVN